MSSHERYRQWCSVLTKFKWIRAGQRFVKTDSKREAYATTTWTTESDKVPLVFDKKAGKVYLVVKSEVYVALDVAKIMSNKSGDPFYDIPASSEECSYQFFAVRFRQCFRFHVFRRLRKQTLPFE